MSSGKISMEYIALDCKVLSLQIDPRGTVLIEKTVHKPVLLVISTYIFYGYSVQEKNI